MVTIQPPSHNLDAQVAEGFGDEWTRFDQSGLDAAEKRKIFEEYFAIFPWQLIGVRSVGADIGCGSGRWASVVASSVGKLYCFDASPAALAIAQRNLAAFSNCECVEASVGALPIADDSLDFAYSLGVLHHVPDTAAALGACASKLRRGAPFLLYLYYRFDNRPWWYQWLWRSSEVLRAVVSRLPYWARYVASQLAAFLIYVPCATAARVARAAGLRVTNWPLAYYADKTLYVMRTDALDRFGTRLEQRFTQAEIHRMMQAAGLENIRFSEKAPYWCAVGLRA